MKKFNIQIIVIFLFIFLSSAVFGQIKAGIHEHMKFRQLNTRSIGQNVVGEGVIEITAEEEDFGKIIEITFVKNGVLTNGKNAVQVENFSVEERFEKFEIKNKTTLIKCFATIDKRKISRKKIDSIMLEGEYKGVMPLMIAVYEKEESTSEEIK